MLNIFSLIITDKLNVKRFNLDPLHILLYICRIHKIQ